MKSGRNLRRYDRAREKTAADLHALYEKVASQVGADEAAIFRAHESILHDPAFTAKIRSWIVSERLSAPGSLHRLLEEYTALFARTEDDYLRERLADVRDVIVRLSGHLTDVLAPHGEVLKGPLVLVANELLPSQVVTLGQREVAGIVTETGGQTSHAAILARSRGIPAVSGVKGILRHVKTGDTIVVDGRDGHVVINPDAGDAQAPIANCSESSSISKTRWPKTAISRPLRPTASGWNCWPISTACPTRRPPSAWVLRAWGCSAPSTSF